MIRVRKVFLSVGVLTILIFLAGCEMGYYVQAAKGQWGISRGSEPVETVRANPETSEELRNRLELAERALQFAAVELGLDPGDSYSRYADIGRPYVVWNVFAAPEFSLEPVSWCFPVAGCVNYRGYFAEEDARSYAEKIRQQGNDVFVGGVRAYSTLGRFRDPLLSTMLTLDDVEFVGLLFHELAHQRVYAADDTPFNEGFAVAVEEIGVERWLARTGDPELIETWREQKQLRQMALDMLDIVRQELEAVYLREMDATERRLARQQVFNRAANNFSRQAARISGLGAYAPWFGERLNNAFLVAVGSYEDLQPSFRALFKQNDNNLPVFYALLHQLP
jgi:predicted aminopeptidase